MLSKFFLAIIILVHVFVLTKLIYFPYPELFIYPYLTNHGLKPYQQILDQHFPGLMFLPVNFDNLGMNTPQQARIWSIAIVLIIHLMLYVLSIGIFKSQWKALIVNFLYLIWQPFFEGWVLWIDSFLPLILLPGYYLLSKNRFLLSGIFFGIGIVFKQVMIPLSLFILVLIFWQNRKLKTALSFLIGVIIPIGFMMIYLNSLGVLSDFWYWAVIFNLTTYAQFGRGAEPTLAHFSRVFLVFATPFLVVKNLADKDVQIILIMLIGTLFGLSTRFDFVHFQPALPFAVLGTILGASKFWKSKLFKIFALIYLLAAAWWLGIFYKGHIGEKIYFFDNQIYELANLVKQYTKPAEKIFVFGASPHLYQMADRMPSGDIFVFQFPWFLKIAEERLLDGIKKDQPKIIVSSRETIIEGEKIKNYAAKIDRYIQQNYQKIDQIGNTDIMRLKID